MRLDHLLSKEEQVGIVLLLSCQRQIQCQEGILLDNLYSVSYNRKAFLVAIRLGDTPVPIPNTTVKTLAADGTVLVTARESRRLPDIMGL